MTKIVTIEKLLKNVTLSVANKLDPPKPIGLRGRKRMCTNKQYVEGIFFVNKSGIGWEYLTWLPVKGNTVEKKRDKWATLGVFDMTWKIILSIYSYFKLDFEDLFIDATHVKNLLGEECVGSNHYDRGRLGTKISVLTDNMGIPVGIDFDGSNRHDIMLVESTLDSVPISLNSGKYLIADKGYCSKKLENKLAKVHLLKLITPRKNKIGQKGKIRGRKPQYHYKLKYRYINEHIMGWMKNYRRLRFRMDRKIKYYKASVFFIASNIVAQKIGHVLRHNYQ